MGLTASLVWAVLLAVDPQAVPAPAAAYPDATAADATTTDATPADVTPPNGRPVNAAALDESETTESPDVAAEPEGGAGVSPIEIVPRVELRHSFQKLTNGVSVNDTTAEIDIQFVKRILLRYQLPFRVLGTPTGQTSGLGDVQFGALGIVYADATRLLAIVLGSVLDTASQPALGAGKQQIVFGGGGAIKPRRWLLPYVLLQEQISVGGNSARPDVNEFMVDLGTIVFGRQYNWLKADLLPTVDFPGGATPRLFGVLEVGSLLVGRIGLFARAGTQMAGSAQLDYSLACGIRYLFRLERGRSKTPEPMM